MKFTSRLAGFYAESSKSRLLLMLAVIAMVLPLAVVSGQRRKPITPPRDGNSGEGLQFQLSEGAEEKDRAQSINTPPATTLSDEDTNNLLKRLPAIKTEADDQKEFAMRDRSLPPPKTGQTINASFPPADNVGLPDQTAFGPLEIVRFAPEGEVALAPHLTITFSQPMIAVTSVMDLAASQVPVKLSPATPGKWRIEYDEWEFCHILSGVSIIAEDGGEARTVKAGDSFVLRPGLKDEAERSYGLARFMAETRRLYGVMDRRLEGRDWIMGNEYTVADIATFPWVNNLVGFYGAGDLVGFADFTHIHRALAAFMARPAVVRGLGIPQRPAV